MEGTLGPGGVRPPGPSLWPPSGRERGGWVVTLSTRARSWVSFRGLPGPELLMETSCGRRGGRAHAQAPPRRRQTSLKGGTRAP